MLSVVLAGNHTGGGRGVFESRFILGWQAIQVVSEFMSGEGHIDNSPLPPYSLRRRSRGGLARRAEIGVGQSPSALSVVLGWQAILVEVDVF